MEKIFKNQNLSLKMS